MFCTIKKNSSICLHLQACKIYLNSISTFAINHVPIMGLFLMLVATVGSLRATSTVDFFEFAAKTKLSFRCQSYVFVEYNAILPLLLLVSCYDTIKSFFLFI